MLVEVRDETDYQNWTDLLTHRHTFVFSDLHIKDRFGSLPYLKYVNMFVKAVDAYMSSQSHPVEVLHLGDLFDTSRPSANEVDCSFQLLKTFNSQPSPESGVDSCFFLMGNHSQEEIGKKDIEKVVIENSNISHVQAIDSVSSISSLINGITSYRAIPYHKGIFEYGKFKEALDSVQGNVALFHGGFNNALGDMGYKLEKGVTLELGDLNGVDLLVAGDYHRHQLIDNPDGKAVVYCGAVFPFSFGHQFQGRVGFIHTETNENSEEVLIYSSIPTSYFLKEFGAVGENIVPKYLTFDMEVESPKNDCTFPLDSNSSVIVEQTIESEQFPMVRVIYDRSNPEHVALAQTIKAEAIKAKEAYPELYTSNYFEKTISIERREALNIVTSSQEMEVFLERVGTTNEQVFQEGFMKYVRDSTKPSDRAAVFEALKMIEEA